MLLEISAFGKLTFPEVVKSGISESDDPRLPKLASLCVVFGGPGLCVSGLFSVALFAVEALAIGDLLARWLVSNIA